MSKEKPILFSGEMVKAILEGRKTVTRRVMKPQPINVTTGHMVYAHTNKPVEWFEFDDVTSAKIDCMRQGIAPRRGEVRLRLRWIREKRNREPQKWSMDEVLSSCPYGQPGDRLWVRETTIISPPNFGFPEDNTHTDPNGNGRIVQYLATSPSREGADMYNLKATPSIFMPRWASRTTLKVTAVRAEKLQDICEAWQVWAEGIEKPDWWENMDSWISPDTTAVEMFAELWDKINAKRGFSWERNPWVWVVEFERVTE